MKNKHDDIYDAKGRGITNRPKVDADVRLDLMRRATWRRGLGFAFMILIILGIAAYVVIEENNPEPTEPFFSLTTNDIFSIASATNSIPAISMATRDELQAPLITFSELPTNRPAEEVDAVKAAKAMTILKQANRYLMARDFVRAEIEARKALEEWPGMTAAYRMLGAIFTQQGQFEQAKTALELALDGDPFNPETYNNLAIVHMQKGRLQKAEELYLTALEINPGYLGALINLGILYVANGDYNSAVDYLERSLEQVPRDESVRNNLAVSWIRLGQYEEARRHLERIIKDSPETASAYFNLAIAYALENRTEEALSWIRRGSQYCSPVELQRFMADSDLDSLRDNPEFQSILNQVYPELPRAPALPGDELLP